MADRRRQAEPDSAGVDRSEQTRNHALDALRAGAAVIVVAGHVRGLFFASSDSATNVATKAFYTVTGIGHQAVIVFFVLSGIVVGRAANRSVRSFRDFPDFGIRRLSRLWVVLVPALALTWFVDYIGSHYVSDASIYGGGGAFRFIVPDGVQSHLGWTTLLANAAFLQDIRGHTFGSNGALWSLSYEFWYYISCPLVLVGVRANARQRAVAVALLVGVSFFVGPMITRYFLIWGLGWLVGTVPIAAARRVPAWASLATIAAAAVVLSRMGASELMRDVALGFIVAAAVLPLVNGVRTNSRLVRVLAPAAGFSFSLYAVHLPLLVLLRAWTERSQDPWVFGVASVVAFSFILSVAVGVAYVFGLATENRTEAVRRWMSAPLTKWTRTLS